MTFHLLRMGSPEVDDPYASVPARAGGAIGKSAYVTIEPEAWFAISAVIDIGYQLQIGRPRQGDAVLFDIDGIFGRSNSIRIILCSSN